MPSIAIDFISSPWDCSSQGLLHERYLTVTEGALGLARKGKHILMSPRYEAPLRRHSLKTFSLTLCISEDPERSVSIQIKISAYTLPGCHMHTSGHESEVAEDGDLVVFRLQPLTIL